MGPKIEGPVSKQCPSIGSYRAAQESDFSHNEAAVFVPGMQRFVPGPRTALHRAQGSVRRFMDSNPHTVLHFISGCIDILDSEIQVVS